MSTVCVHPGTKVEVFHQVVCDVVWCLQFLSVLVMPYWFSVTHKVLYNRVIHCNQVAERHHSCCCEQF
jgi:hypothetical protein